VESVNGKQSDYSSRSVWGGTVAQLRSQVIKDPDPTWLNHFAERMELHLKRPQPIEQARRRACNTVAIETVFERFGLSCNVRNV
jgi:hypothetical protein